MVTKTVFLFFWFKAYHKSFFIFRFFIIHILDFKTLNPSSPGEWEPDGPKDLNLTLLPTHSNVTQIFALFLSISISLSLVQTQNTHTLTLTHKLFFSLTLRLTQNTHSHKHTHTHTHINTQRYRVPLSVPGLSACP